MYVYCVCLLCIYKYIQYIFENIYIYIYIIIFYIIYKYI